MNVRIPLAKPEITDADRDAVLEVLRTPHLSMGPKLAEFEQEICDYTGCNYAVAVNSGTSALQLAVRALELEPGAEVILPSFTFSALLNVILQEGLRSRFVDIDPDTYSMTPEIVAAAITPRTRLVLAVHTFGFPVEVELLREVTERSGRLRPGRPHHARNPHRTIHIIEDACEALGAELRRTILPRGRSILWLFRPQGPPFPGSALPEQCLEFRISAQFVMPASRLQPRYPKVSYCLAKYAKARHFQY